MILSQIGIVLNTDIYTENLPGYKDNFFKGIDKSWYVTKGESPPFDSADKWKYKLYKSLKE